MPKRALGTYHLIPKGSMSLLHVAAGRPPCKIAPHVSPAGGGLIPWEGGHTREAEYVHRQAGLQPLLLRADPSPTPVPWGWSSGFGGGGADDLKVSAECVNSGAAEMHASRPVRNCATE